MKDTKPSSFTVIITLSLVIFILGLLGVLVINAAQLNTHIKENVSLTVFYKTDVQAREAKKVSDSLLRQPYAKGGTYISSEDAIFNFKNEIGEDFVEMLGNNPLPASLEMAIASTYTDNARMAQLERQLGAIDAVQQVSYPKDVFQQIDKNRRLISYWLIGLSIVLVLAAVALMSNTIRILIYADRFIIKNQQLIGAKERFILKPYKKKALRWTIFSFVIGVMFLFGVFWLIFGWLNASMDLNIQAILQHFKENWYQYFLMLFLLLLGVVVVIFVATHLAAKKYLHTHTDNLYT
jgi:cell division transport system permease protein